MSDRIISAPSNQAYRDNFDRAFAPKIKPGMSKDEIADYVFRRWDTVLCALADAPDSEGGETD